MCSIPYSRAASLAGKNCIPLVITFTCDELREKRISVGSSPIRRVGEGVDFVGGGLFRGQMWCGTLGATTFYACREFEEAFFKICCG